MSWNWNDAFTGGALRIRDEARLAARNAEMLAGFQYHKPAWGYHQIVAAANDLRQAADDLDKLAAKVAPETEAA